MHVPQLRSYPTTLAIKVGFGLYESLSQAKTDKSNIKKILVFFIENMRDSINQVIFKSLNTKTIPT